MSNSLSLDKNLQEYDQMLLQLHHLTKNLSLKYENCIDEGKLNQLSFDIDNRDRLIQLIDSKYQEIESTIKKWFHKQTVLNANIKSLEEILLENLQKNKSHFQQQIQIEKKFNLSRSEYGK